ncbi:hypothetical protein GBA52_007039 [Prunus armeniaca]|nr:hypothetical protein GBA52_007039 [Prunus armeniaca]
MRFKVESHAFLCTKLYSLGACSSHIHTIMTLVDSPGSQPRENMRWEKSLRSTVVKQRANFSWETDKILVNSNSDARKWTHCYNQ